MSLDPVRIEDTRSWFRKARHDIRAAELLMPEALVDEVAFHCQQAVEKCLKGFLFWHGRSFKKTHDLNILGLDCIQVDGNLQSILPAIAPLTQYAVEYRYPGPIVHPTDIEAEELIELAKSLYQAIAQLLPFPIG